MMSNPNTSPGYRLPFSQRFSYGVGHVLNDLCASMWFSYLLVFFHQVINFSNEMAGYVMLLGQIADALATPFIGFESDRTAGIGKYGKRKTWHLIGTFCVMCSFPFLFMECIGGAHADQWAKFIYYAPFVVIFQFGWAATQISHLSLIPELTPNESERVELNAIRYAFTVLANIIIYGICWLLLDLHTNIRMKSEELSPSDAPQFRTLALIAVGVGAVFSLIFHLGTKEPKMDRDRSVSINEKDSDMQPVQRYMEWKDWLKENQFYQIGILYMCTRLTVNISQAYMPMYLTDSISLSKEYIAVIPLISYVSGFAMSFAMKPINKLLGRKVTYLIGALCIIGSCIWMWFIKEGNQLTVIGPAVLIGAGGSTILVTSLSMCADLIGSRTESGAFVYGSMSFTDKLSNGLAVTLIQNLHPCKTQACCPACVWYYRDVMVILPGAAAVLALILLLTLAPMKIGTLKRDQVANREFSEPFDESEKAPLLKKDANDDCCDYALCFSTSNDPIARNVTQDIDPCQENRQNLTSSNNSARSYGTLVDSQGAGSNDISRRRSTSGTSPNGASNEHIITAQIEPLNT